MSGIPRGALAAVLTWATCPPAVAQRPDPAPTAGVPAEAAADPNPYAGDLRARLRLLGDPGGRRSALADRGVTADVFLTQFYQGVARGGREQEFEYGGKIDSLFRLDAGKLGLVPGFFVDVHAETRYGNSTNNIDGLLAPSNLPLSFPEPDSSITSLTGLKFTQALGENFAAYLGKINTLDEYPLKYSPGLGTNRPGLGGFLNTSFVFNPIAARTVPYSAAGVGFAVLRDREPVFTFTVFDPEERSSTDLSGLYDRGVVLVPDLLLRTKVLGRPGLYNVGGTYSTAEYRSTDPTAYLDVLNQFARGNRPGPFAAPVNKSSWCVYTNFYQSLWVDPDDEKRNWGLFGQFGVSDGNPNPIKFVANGGVGGRSMLRGRALDTFGVGYFYLGLSDGFKALSRPLLPQRDEYGVELFYNLAVTPWARLTGDLQIARPSTVRFDTAVIPGLRFQILF